MFVNIKIKSIFFIFIFSFINSQFKEYYDMSEETYYYSLPNEFPTIIQNHQIDDVEDLSKKIGKIFGYLPFTEQYFLLNDNFFDLISSHSSFVNSLGKGTTYLLFIK